MSLTKELYEKFRAQIFEVIDAGVLNEMTTQQLTVQIEKAIGKLCENYPTPVPSVTRAELTKNLVDELIGLGPLQSLMEDESISDIMVNGVDEVFIERNGKTQKADISFMNHKQLLEIAKRIANNVGRRVDESSPLCDARLADGSRVNVVIPPIALDGVAISIRKFKEQKLGLRELVGFGAMSPAMARVLMIAARCRLNIIISGGTGSGKTTMLNALSQYIGNDERILTIEDAAELRIQQPHVVRLETRPASTEGSGAITQRDLVINALRMRPERIILGECRGAEAFEMLQAMNTGHDGSMSTLHANTPRDALSRIESMVMMANLALPLPAIRRTIVSAVHLIIQVNRLRDGSRKVTSISELYGLEGEAPVMEEIFKFVPDQEQAKDKVNGQFVTSGLPSRSQIHISASEYGLSKELEAAFEMEVEPA
ncbi:CpaF family protein [Vibrio breoganii]|uniref:CpaF family protein n=1 Tax=Vibrio breoganii TaxID=553239 RepID=UPI000C8174F8|nr:CpaF family protein [Vibrio breoganii]PMJ47471.1 pilus assembly protein CpaF [Vibrio breoganii]PML40196.1 pilus assembly protein CpaF [Vibrio breoganii]PMO65987.1 pilus assembly protein CpaF [Vibrio breoganii]PMO76026.1 pilus assembly protein CpaF [Vibrio breoganii]PMO88174.1 pilus assembly protein CpaF [Vibrio breoganii]